MLDCADPSFPLRPAQIAYHVADPVAAAVECARRYGWGPFYLLEHVPLASCVYRGREASFDHSSAYGQAGDVMVELITQHDDQESVVREAFRRDQSGIHHIAHFVPNLNAAIDHCEREGGAVVMDAHTADGVRFVMVQMPMLGHYLELYEPTPPLSRFYAYIKKKSIDWDGIEPLRRFG
jgi:hypothetical protein